MQAAAEEGPSLELPKVFSTSADEDLMLEYQRPPARANLASRRLDEVNAPQARTAAARPRDNILLIVWRHRTLVVVSVAVALVFGIIYVARATPIYGSSSLVCIQQNVPAVINDQLTGTGDYAGYLATQAELIHSSAILAKALTEPGVSEAQCLAGVENRIGWLKGSVSAALGKQDDFVTVSAEATDPADAAVVANGVVQAYIDYQDQQHKSTALEVLAVLQNQRDHEEADLKSIQQKMFEAKKASPELAMQTDRGNVVVNMLDKYGDVLMQAQLRAIDIQLAATEARSAGDDPVAIQQILNGLPAENIQSSNLDTMIGRTEQAREELDELTAALGVQHPRVIAKQHELNQLQAKLEASVLQAKVMLQSELATANQRIAALQEAVDDTRKSAMTLNVSQAEYDQLSQEAQSVERSLDLIDDRMKEVNVGEDTGTLTVSVLEPAKPNPTPIRPNRSHTLGLALAAGLILGVSLATVTDMFDHRIRTPEEVVGLLGLPILGVVPRIPGKRTAFEYGQEIQLSPRSEAAEAYRTIRTAVYFAMGDRQAKTLLITSPSPGDGKSTLASNLAIAMAQAGRRVLLIDADCRHPTQDKIFEGREGVGLSTVLRGGARLEEALQRTNIEKLEILPCGPLPDNPAELLDSRAMADLISLTSQQYDLVLVDSPPVAEITDARILAATCDGVVLVLRAGRSTRRMAQQARDGLASVGARILGVVINGMPRDKGGFQSAQYYGSGRYGYANGKAAKKAEANGEAKVHRVRSLLAESTNGNGNRDNY